MALDFLYFRNRNIAWSEDETVELSSKISKINKRGKIQPRIFLLTNKAIYNIKTDKHDKIKLTKNNEICYQRRIDLLKVKGITVAALTAQFTIHFDGTDKKQVKDNYFYQPIHIYRREQIVNKLTSLLASKQINGSITVQSNGDSHISFGAIASHKPVIKPSRTDISAIDLPDPKKYKNSIEKLNPHALSPNSLRPSTFKRYLSHKNKMNLMKYFVYLVHGYIRSKVYKNIMDGNLVNVCDQIRKYYQPFQWNDFCTVDMQRDVTPTNLLIKTKKNAPETCFGAKFVSKIPINESKLNINIINSGFKFKNDEFKAIAINNYYASVSDEIDLEENKVYTILEIGDDSSTHAYDGWWYAMNSNGDSGWIPCDYLQKIYSANIAIGITTNPELFIINEDYIKNPFESECVKHAICRTMDTVLLVQNGIETETMQEVIIDFETRLDVVVKNGQLIITQNNEILCKQELFMKDDGNCMDYYFAMTCTVPDPESNNCVAKYRICGNLL